MCKCLFQTHDNDKSTDRQLIGSYFEHTVTFFACFLQNCPEKSLMWCEYFHFLKSMILRYYWEYVNLGFEDLINCYGYFLLTFYIPINQENNWQINPFVDMGQNQILELMIFTKTKKTYHQNMKSERVNIVYENIWYIYEYPLQVFTTNMWL